MGRVAVKTTLIEVPYDSGHYARRMGRGPVHLVQGGLAGLLERAGHEVRLVEVRLVEDFLTEVGTALETQRLVAECVAGEIAEGRFPLVLSGNCATSVGSVAGAGARRTGVVWLDSHGDYNTPETTASGFFDGMVLARVTGECWTAAAARVPGFEPVPTENVVLVAVRDLDPAERDLLTASDAVRVDVEAIRERGTESALAAAFDALADRVDQAYLHLDLDVLDPEVARINDFQAPGGLTVEEVAGVITALAARLPIRVAALTAFDPDADADGAGGEAAVTLAPALVGAAR